MTAASHPAIITASADVIAAAGLPTLSEAFLLHPAQRPRCLRFALATLVRRGGPYAVIAARWRAMLVAAGQI